MGLDKSSPQEFARPWGASTHRVRSGTLENPPGEFHVSISGFFLPTEGCPRRAAPGGLPPARYPLKIKKNGPLENQVSFFRFVLSPEGGPPARNPFEIREIGPLEKGVSFFQIVCPRREDPWLAILLNPDSKKENPDSTKANPDSTGP